MILRFSRFRFKEGKESEGEAVLRAHVAAMKAAPGCADAWLGQGQHPSTEFVALGLFRDEGAARAFEGRLRSDPSLGSDFFTLLRMTTAPPEVTTYELR